MTVTEIESATRAEIAEAIHNLCHRAAREFPRVGSHDHPTAWDKRHQAINAKLDAWQAAR